MTDEYGEYLYIAALLALGFGIAVHARCAHRKSKMELIKAKKSEDFDALATRIRAQTPGRKPTPSEELLREGRDERELQYASRESEPLTREEKEALQEAIEAKAAELEELYQKLPCGRYKTLALTDLEASVMWIIKELAAYAARSPCSR